MLALLACRCALFPSSRAGQPAVGGFGEVRPLQRRPLLAACAVPTCIAMQQVQVGMQGVGGRRGVNGLAAGIRGCSCSWGRSVGVSVLCAGPVFAQQLRLAAGAPNKAAHRAHSAL